MRAVGIKVYNNNYRDFEQKLSLLGFKDFFVKKTKYKSLNNEAVNFMKPI